jgi:K+-sensing histidine kinase KdpD
MSDLLVFAARSGGVHTAGHLRIYLGLGSGAGKTTAMLAEGSRRRCRGADVALVDGLDKRWRDIVDLLAEGIDVITTVDVQHLEGVEDAAERITGARVRERVPDWVVRKADRIELVDSFCPSGQAACALRELALGFLVDQVDAELAAA